MINKYLSVRMEGGRETVIYVAGKRFQQCKALILNLPVREIHDPASPTSIDEAAALYRQSSISSRSSKIPPEVEFWGHCSNLQAWADHDYDSRLLHRNLAFPLLTALADAGDSHARAVLGREVIARFTAGYMPVVKYLVEGEYYRFLTAADLDHLPPEVLIELYGTSVYDLYPAVFERLPSLPPIITLGGKRCPIKDGTLEVHNRRVSNKELEELPKYKDRVIRLDLSDNQLQSLPDAIGNLASLKNLNLRGNQLRALPDAIGHLTSLQGLNLRGNQLRALPDAIGNLRSLEWLFLDNNQLRALPDAMGNLASLKTIYLSRNQLRALPDAMGNLRSLEWLFLDNNRLRALPDAIGNLASLQQLELDFNLLRTLPESVINLKLEDLSLWGNKGLKLSTTVKRWKDELEARNRDQIPNTRLSFYQEVYAIKRKYHNE